MDEYDYIVVGGGTAGSVLAARLSEDPGTKVLLLEAGSTQPLPAMSVPPAWPELMGSTADWGYETTPQAAAGPIEYPRGRALGGSGAINAMAHFRGHAAVYDRWPPGWRRSAARSPMTCRARGRRASAGRTWRSPTAGG